MKAKTTFYCTACGNETPRWQGRCPACGAWNTMEEHVEAPAPAARGKTARPQEVRRPKPLSEVDCGSEVRFPTGLGELDRVLGGGAVQDSLVLVAGAPGIGKSTLLLQICSELCRTLKVLYVSGEESAGQIKLRAQRLGVSTDNLLLLCETDLSQIVAAAEELRPDVFIADSIQTLYDPENAASPGSVTQVKACTLRLMQLAKGSGITVFVVGHVNKDGAIAGPKVLEHMVDCVLYFEGESASLKWRTGACGRCPTPRSCCSRAARPTPRAPVWPAPWRAAARCWPRSRRWWPAPPSMCPAAWPTALISTGRCC